MTHPARPTQKAQKRNITPHLLHVLYTSVPAGPAVLLSTKYTCCKFGRRSVVFSNVARRVRLSLFWLLPPFCFFARVDSIKGALCSEREKRICESHAAAYYLYFVQTTSGVCSVIFSLPSRHVHLPPGEGFHHVESSVESRAPQSRTSVERDSVAMASRE